MEINISAAPSVFFAKASLLLAKCPGNLLSRAGVLITVLDLMALHHLVRQGNTLETIGVHAALTLGLTMLGFELVKRTLAPGKSRWNAWITASILFLILHPGMTGMDFGITVACALACASASVLLSLLTLHKGKVWVNPVVLALLVVGTLSPFLNFGMPFVSWWGTGFGHAGQTWIWTLVWTIVVVTEWKKWPALLGFLAVMVSLNWGAFAANSTLLFLGSVMLIEPKSSPFRPSEQGVYGVLAGLALVAFTKFGVPQASLWALALANLSFTTGLLGTIRKSLESPKNLETPKPTPSKP
jgi:hypothetical protein